MHGIIFVELKKYVQSKVSPGAWETLLTKSGLTHTAYLATSVYPDEQMVALVTTASSLTGTAIPILLEDFGEFLVPGLIKRTRLSSGPIGGRWTRSNTPRPTFTRRCASGTREHHRQLFRSPGRARMRS
jgi:hypothetical protein